MHGTTIAIRQVRYLHNMEEQDHSFEAAPCTLTGVELMQMIRKGQLASGAEQALTAAEQFYALAAKSSAQQGSLYHRSKFATHPMLPFTSSFPVHLAQVV